MKISDRDFLSAIWKGVVSRLPYTSTHNYFGNQRGLTPNDKFYMRYATHVCTAFRSNFIKFPIGNNQSMRRIHKLIERGILGSEPHRKGSAFHFWLPDGLNQRAFSRTIELLTEKGFTEKPRDATGFDEVAKEISEILLAEFGEYPHELMEVVE